MCSAKKQNVQPTIPSCLHSLALIFPSSIPNGIIRVQFYIIHIHRTTSAIVDYSYGELPYRLLSFHLLTTVRVSGLILPSLRYQILGDTREFEPKGKEVIFTRVGSEDPCFHLRCTQPCKGALSDLESV